MFADIKKPPQKIATSQELQARAIIPPMPKAPVNHGQLDTSFTEVVLLLHGPLFDPPEVLLSAFDDVPLVAVKRFPKVPDEEAD